MSWDIVLFSSEQNIVSLVNLNEDLLKPIDFDKVLKSKFKNIKKTENHNEITEKDFSIDFFDDEELVSNKMLNLEKPEENGYFNFKTYLNSIIKKE